MSYFNKIDFADQHVDAFSSYELANQNIDLTLNSHTRLMPTYGILSQIMAVDLAVR